MNRSRYVPQQQYAIFGIGPVPTPAQMPGAPGGMMHHPGMQQVPGFPNNSPSPHQQAQQAAFGSPNPNALGASPILQQAMSPSALWTAQFANGPIIEDLCAPPPHHVQMGLASPPMNALPPRGVPPGMMHHLAQVQNVYGVRQPGFHMMPPQQPGRLTVPGAGFPPPPQGYGLQLHQQQMQMHWQLQQQHAQAQAQQHQQQQQQRHQQQQLEMELAAGLAGHGPAAAQQGQQQIDSPQLGGPGARAATPGQQAMIPPLTPVEAFLTADI